jgi:1-acylglycerone phosphate reductase
MTSKSVLITGCSTGGIGASIAKSFQNRGYLVFATARNLSKLPHELVSSQNVETITLDVTSSSSIAAAAQVVSKRTGGKLDVLVNNSGAGYTSPGLDVNIEKAKALYDVNFWGVLAMTQAFAPMLIKAKGTVVNISSISGSLYDGYTCKYHLFPYRTWLAETIYSPAWFSKSLEESIDSLSNIKTQQSMGPPKPP